MVYSPGRVVRLLRTPLFRFLCVGGAATLFQWMLLAAFVELLHIPAVAASALSYLLAAMLNYLLNYYFTFQSRKSHVVASSQFVLVVIIGIAVNTATFYGLFQVLPHYLPAQVGATFAALVVNFLLHQYWIYRS